MRERDLWEGMYYSIVRILPIRTLFVLFAEEMFLESRLFRDRSNSSESIAELHFNTTFIQSTQMQLTSIIYENPLADILHVLHIFVSSILHYISCWSSPSPSIFLCFTCLKVSSLDAVDVGRCYAGIVRFTFSYSLERRTNAYTGRSQATWATPT